MSVIEVVVAQQTSTDSHQMDLANFSLILPQLPLPEDRYDLLQTARLYICRHVVWQMPCGMGLLSFTVGKHEGLVILRPLHQIQCVLMFFFTLITEACDNKGGSAADMASGGLFGMSTTPI